MRVTHFKQLQKTMAKTELNIEYFEFKEDLNIKLPRKKKKRYKESKVIYSKRTDSMMFLYNNKQRCIIKHHELMLLFKTWCYCNFIHLDNVTSTDFHCFILNKFFSIK